MSRAAKITLLSSIIFTIDTVYFVHNSQEQERNAMLKMIIKEDLEEIEQRKRKNREELEHQLILQRHLQAQEKE